MYCFVLTTLIRRQFRLHRIASLSRITDEMNRDGKISRRGKLAVRPRPPVARRPPRPAATRAVFELDEATDCNQVLFSEVLIEATT